MISGYMCSVTGYLCGTDDPDADWDDICENCPVSMAGDTNEEIYNWNIKGSITGTRTALWTGGFARE